MDTVKAEKQRVATRKYASQNKEKVRERFKAWIAKNPDYNKKYLAKKYKEDPALFIWRNCKQRARRIGAAFNILRQDVVVPETCPVLGIPLFQGTAGFQPNSPSVDRIDPKLGYVQGNVRVISYRANQIKGDATPEELLKVALYAQEAMKAQ